jgi:hypothetical protein
MKRALYTVFFASLATLAGSAVMGCGDGDYDNLNGGGNPAAGGPNGEGSSGNGGVTPASLQCTQAPEGRSYAMFDGMKLEESRANENVGVNRARVKPFAAMTKEFQRVLGVVPPSLKDAGGSFDVPAARWYGETQYSAVSLHAMATISYEGCLAYVKGKPEFAAVPTDATATAECSSLMRKAWNRSPSPTEIAGCSDLAVKSLADEKDVARRWAYACASVLSSSQFLTF